MKRGTGLACSLSILLLSVTTASAAIITFGYTATGGGGTVTGTFGYDDSVPVTFNPVPTSGVYVGAGFLIGSVVGGPQDGAMFNLSNSEVLVQNGATSEDRLEITAASSTFLQFIDPTSTAFGDFSLPTMLTLSDFATRQLFLHSLDIGLQVPDQIQYTLQSITNPIPAPSTMLLFGTGLAALVGWR